MIQLIENIEWRQLLTERNGVEKFLHKKGITDREGQVGKGKCGRWFGWSHRAVCSFGIGDKLFQADFGDDNTPFVKHGTKTIAIDADAKEAARRFARYVS